MAFLAQPTFAQPVFPRSFLPRDQYRNGETTLRAFTPVSTLTRHSIVKLNVDGETVALGVVMETNGLVLTKASELRPGKLTAWLASEREVAAELLATDLEEDVALVRADAPDLKPIAWTTEPVALGQWAVSPGIAETPHAVGIISALPRRIRPQRAFIGVQFDLATSAPRIDQTMAGLGAEKAGLKPGDLIVAVNGATVTNRQQVAETLREYRAGQTVQLHVLREDKKFEVPVRLMVPEPSTAGSMPSTPRFDRAAGELSHRAEGFEEAIEHDTVLHPWLCGGPLVNLDGKAVGLNIARASRVSTYALPSTLVKRLFDRLRQKAHNLPAPPPNHPASGG
jgi:serine protease Do